MTDNQSAAEALAALGNRMGTHSTVRDWVYRLTEVFAGADLYFGHGTDNPQDEACVLVVWCLGIEWNALDAYADTAFSEAQQAKLLEAARARIVERKPMPYITGEAYFFGMKFKVDEHVLIPRSPFAELVDQQFSPWVSHKPESLLDLCTGSGCIGIACAVAFPEARVDLSDISEHALTLAQQNVALHGCEDRVEVLQSDLFNDLEGRRYDVIVSNPPYVDAQDMAALPREYRHEPELALASGDDGLHLTRRLLSEAYFHLNEGGHLFVEVGNSWPALEALYPDAPFIWLEFEHGGHGVFYLTRDDLSAFCGADEA